MGVQDYVRLNSSDSDVEVAKSLDINGEEKVAPTTTVITKETTTTTTTTPAVKKPCHRGTRFLLFTLVLIQTSPFIWLIRVLPYNGIWFSFGAAMIIILGLSAIISSNVNIMKLHLVVSFLVYFLIISINVIISLLLTYYSLADGFIHAGIVTVIMIYYSVCIRFYIRYIRAVKKERLTDPSYGCLIKRGVYPATKTTTVTPVQTVVTVVPPTKVSPLIYNPQNMQQQPLDPQQQQLHQQPQQQQYVYPPNYYPNVPYQIHYQAIPPNQQQQHQQPQGGVPQYYYPVPYYYSSNNNVNNNNNSNTNNNNNNNTNEDNNVGNLPVDKA